jgi:YegS/Rv2252/BmrU family lipid kinase
MASPFGKAIVIANARAGAGSLGRDKKSLDAILAASGVDFEVRYTQRRGHAADLAREAMEQGHRFLVAMGGDGTIHEVCNGMMDEAGPRDRDAVLGVVPGGSGSDFIRTFGIPPDPGDAAGHLAGDNVFRIDLGRVTFQRNGAAETRYFSNIAEAGLGGEVVRRAEALPRRVGRTRYLIAFWMTLGFYKPSDGKITLDDHVYEGRVTNLVVANGQFFGGGMHIAPKAHPGDGKFDVLIQKGTKGDYIKGITKVFKAEHLPSPVIKEFHAQRVEVTTAKPLQVEADGEVLGFTPATFEIVPDALNLKI